MRLPKQNQITPSPQSRANGAPIEACALSDRLNADLEKAHQSALDSFPHQKTPSGFGAVFFYLATFFYHGIVRAKFLRAADGFVECSVVAQDAYNRRAMIYSMAVQRK